MFLKCVQKHYCSNECKAKSTWKWSGNIGKGLKQSEKFRQFAESMKGIPKTEKHRQNMSSGRKGIKLSRQHKINMALASKESWKRLTSSEKEKKLRGFQQYNFPTLESAKVSRRIKTMQRIQELGGCRIGKHETKILDNQEKIDYCKIQRQFPVNDLGYIVDGYCSETNTVYEVYESYHTYRQEQDLKRQQQIQQSLGCNFVVLWENQNVV